MHRVNSTRKTPGGDLCQPIRSTKCTPKQLPTSLSRPRQPLLAHAVLRQLPLPELTAVPVPLVVAQPALRVVPLLQGDRVHLHALHVDWVLLALGWDVDWSECAHFLSPSWPGIIGEV